jgi:mannosyltransferase
MFVARKAGWTGTLALRAVLPLIGVFVVGAALRIYDLGGESLWTDEGFTLWLSRQSVGRVISVASAWEYASALYYLFVHASVVAFGPTEFAIRLPSLLCSLVVLLTTYKIGAELFDSATGVVAALFTALSAFMVRYAQEGRSHMLFAMLALLSLYLYIRMIRDGGWGIRSAYVVVGATLVYAHAYSVFVLAAQALHFLSWRLLGGRPLGVNVVTWAGIHVVLGVVTLPQLLVYLNRGETVAAGELWILPPRLRELPLAVETYAGSPVLAVLFVALLLLGFVTWRVLEGRLSWRDLPGSLESYRVALRLTNLAPGYLLLLWIGVLVGAPFVMSRLGTPIFQVKYTLPASAAFYILAAAGVNALRLAWLRTLALVVIGVLMLFSVQAYYRTVLKPPWREIVPQIEAAAQPGDVLVFHAGFLQELLYDHYSRRPELERIPFVARDISTISTPVTDEALGELTARLAGRDRIFLVLSHASPRDYERIERALEAGRVVAETWTYPGAQVLLLIRPGAARTTP